MSNVTQAWLDARAIPESDRLDALTDTLERLYDTEEQLLEQEERERGEKKLRETISNLRFEIEELKKQLRAKPPKPLVEGVKKAARLARKKSTG